MWTERWFLSCNAKDIGTLYLIFALFSGLIGTAYSILIRLELSGPGVQFIADNQLYNSIITSHGILMIFFMVNNMLHMLNSSSVSCLGKIKEYHTYVNVGNDNDQKDPLKNSNYNYTKITVEDPYNNKDILAKFAKKKRGVYIFSTLEDEFLYVGHSINLYNRVSSYFMPSILKTKARRVLRYLNKHGFTNIKLTLYIMDDSASTEQVVELEQHFIDSLNPTLNVDLVASSSGHHEPLSQEMREQLREQRGIPVFVYDANDFTLLHIFPAKQYMFNTINIHHKTLEDCIDNGQLYLDTFFLSLDLIEESTNNLLTLDEIKALVDKKREIYLVKHPAARVILAEFKDDSSLNRVFHSINSLAKELKGDRTIIKKYLNGTRPGYYRGKWKFTLNSTTE